MPSVRLYQPRASSAARASSRAEPGRPLQEVRSIVRRAVAGALLSLIGPLGLVLPFSTGAANAAAAKGGPVRIFVTLTNNGAAGRVTVVGAIGDFGTVQSIDKTGKPNANGNFVKVSLRHGTFKVDSTSFNKATSNLRPTLNQTTCSGYAVLHGPPVTLFAGTGQYTGISGSLRIEIAFAFVAPRFTSGPHKGQCNFDAGPPSPNDGYSTVTGAGTVAFAA